MAFIITSEVTAGGRPLVQILYLGSISCCKRSFISCLKSLTLVIGAHQAHKLTPVWLYVITITMLGKVALKVVSFVVVAARSYSLRPMALPDTE
jgi:hypothetical protein